MQYEIKRDGATIYSVTPTGQQNKKIMADNIVTMNIDVPGGLDLQINDYVDAFNGPTIERYFLLTLANVKKSSTIEFNYTVTFSGWQYQLAKANIKFPDSDNNYTLSGKPFMGTLDALVDLLIINANRDQSGWTKGIIDDTDPQEIQFNDNDNCLSVLATYATAFKIEYWVVGQTVHMTKRGSVESTTFEYGMGKGLYDITRTTATDKNTVTRLYAYGSTKNLPADYKGYSDKLKLPGTTPYLEKNAWKNPANHSLGYKYGIIENTQVFEEIYPHRTGLVTTVGSDEFTFIDSAIDFDVNAQLLPGVTAHIVFNTGQLGGYTFEIHSFDNASKTFVINPLKDDKGFVLPNDTLNMGVGDQYVVVDIKMPDAYIDAAEAELLAAAQAYLNDNCNPIVTYAVTCDPINFKQRGINLTLGNYVHVIDTDLGLDDHLRITGFTRDLQQPSQYTMELSETVSISPILRSVVANENMVKAVTRIGKTGNRAYNDALQAKSTAEGVKAITDFWGVTIDEEHGIVASGTLLVGSGPVGNAGITGVIDNIDSTDPLNPIDKSVRIWAGAAYEDKDTAPFRVLDNGEMFATRGRIAGFDITNEGLENVSTSDAFIRHVKKDGSGTVISEAVLGTRSVPFFGDNYIAYIANDEPGNVVNNNLYLRASGGSGANYALTIDGQIYANGSASKLSDSFDYELLGAGYRAVFKAGIFMGTIAL